MSQASAFKDYATLPEDMSTYRIDARAAYTFEPRYGVALSIPWSRHTMGMIRKIEPATPAAPVVDESCCGPYPVVTEPAANTPPRPTYQRHTMDPVEGFGDLRIEGTIRLLEAGTPESGRHRLFFRPGIKTPTGDYKVKAYGVLVEPCMQLGTGSWDPTAQLEYRLEKNAFGLSLLGGYQLTTRNPLGYEYGDLATIGAFPSYQPFRMLRITTGLRYRHAETSKDHKGRYTVTSSLSQDPANTGGEWADAIVSLDLLPTDRLTLNIGVSIPVWSDLNGIQQRPSELYTAGASVRF